MTDLHIEARDQKRIDKLGLVVSMHGPDYVVRHPQHKKRKHEGGNLSALITAWEMDLGELTKNGEDKPAPKGRAARVVQPINNALVVDDKMANDLGDKPASSPEPALGEEDPPAQEEGKAVRPKVSKSKTKTKRSSSDWKTYAVGKLILQNADKTPDEIFAMCKAASIETKIMTVVGLSRYFRLCVQIQVDLMKESA